MYAVRYVDCKGHGATHHCATLCNVDSLIKSLLETYGRDTVTITISRMLEEKTDLLGAGAGLVFIVKIELNRAAYARFEYGLGVVAVANTAHATRFAKEEHALEAGEMLANDFAANSFSLCNARTLDEIRLVSLVGKGDLQ